MSSLDLSPFFDNFTLSTRIMPALSASVPIFLVLFHLGYSFEVLNSLEDKFFYFFFFIAILSFFSLMCRNLGKNKETDIIKKLEYKHPIVILLQYSDEGLTGIVKTRYHKPFSEVTRTRYHEALNSKCPALNLPVSPADEKKDEKDAEARYNSAVNWLVFYSESHEDKYSMVYEELKNYSYLRNLYGIKRIFIMLYISFILFLLLQIGPAILSLYFAFSLDALFPFLLSPKIILLFVLVLWSYVFKKTVNEDAVERNLFVYAKRLLEICETFK
jgi:hypothetical protein